MHLIYSSNFLLHVIYRGVKSRRHLLNSEQKLSILKQSLMRQGKIATYLIIHLLHNMATAYTAHAIFNDISLHAKHFTLEEQAADN